MNHNFIFENVDHALPYLMNELMYRGEEFGSRAGLTKEIMHVGITLKQPWQREIVLPERKASIAAQIVETMWVLSGRNDVEGLSHYLPRAADFSDDGQEWRAGYGPRLRNYEGVDQLDYIVGLMSTSPGSRQAVATIWDPVVDTTPGKDIACNNWLSFSSRFGYLDLHVGIRSNDAIWGWSGINAFEWSALQELVAGLSGLLVGSLHFSTTSFHLYERHWDKARRLMRNDSGFVHADSPRFSPEEGDCWSLPLFDKAAQEWFRIERMVRHGNPEAEALVDAFPEPMLRSWLRVLQWYWSGDQGYLEPLRDTRLYEACRVAVKPAGKPQPEQLKMEETTYVPEPVRMLDYLNRLHAEKHAAYGDSWKRRGELGILSNIARKVDRIGTGADTSDETQADTAIDLVVYLAKYRLWLEGLGGDPEQVETLLEKIPASAYPVSSEFDEDLDILFAMAQGKSEAKVVLVEAMLEQALEYARSVWR